MLDKRDAPTLISRRDLLRGAAACSAGLLWSLSGLDALAAGAAAAEAPPAGAAGRALHQAGIATPQQSAVVFAAFDVVSSSVADVRNLLRRWTAAARVLAQGHLLGVEPGNALLPPPDNGESLGLGPSRLSLTFGLGPTFFEQNGRDRFGLAHRRPATLQALPPMLHDALRPEWSGGDLCVQACADDPQVAFHAMRMLIERALGVAVVRWMQSGFLSTPKAPDGAPATPRNLFGFKDGTGNVDTSDVAEMNRHIWVNGDDQPEWMRGGTYLATRKIRMFIEVWDRSSLQDQEQTIGRKKLSGAPLGAQTEFAPLDPAALPVNSHVRLAHGDGRVKLLRRGYSYNDGLDPRTGQLDAGLFFASFQRDLDTRFVPVLRRLMASDRLNEYTQHIGSAVFACPPGATRGGYVGETLFA